MDFANTGNSITSWASIDTAPQLRNWELMLDARFCLFLVDSVRGNCSVSGLSSFLVFFVLSVDGI